MTYQTATISAVVGNDAAYNAWGSAVSNLLTAVGVQKIVDAGQVTWGAVTRPATNTFPYYEIRKLDDPESGANPVYIKFLYGATISSSVASLSVVVGTGHDGSGNITGPPGASYARTETFSGDTNVTSPPAFAACDGDGFVFVYNLGSSKRFVLSVDRQRRASDGVAAPYSGWPTIGHALLLAQQTPGGIHQVNGDPATGDTVAGTRFQVPTGITVTTATSFLNADGEVRVFPLWIATRSAVYGCKMLVGVPVADFPLGMQFNVDHLGAARRYRSLGPQFSGLDAHGNAGMSVAVWQEDL